MCERFPSYKSNTIGPGKYDVNSFNLENLKHKGPTAAFAKGERFLKKKVENIPGPGTYWNPWSIVNDLLK